MLTVAAVGSDLKPPFFSSASAAVDLSAPGVGILTATPPQFDEDGNPDGYEAVTGTSFAAPMVAAAAAWLRAAKPSYPPDQVAQVLRGSARDLERKGWDSATGYGMLNLLGAINRPAPAIDPHEPNDDIPWINGQATGRVDAPIWRRGGARKLRALVDKYEDPADVYRIIFPPRARVRVTLKPRFGNPDLAAFTRSATSTADDEQIIGRSRRKGKRRDPLTLRNPSRRKRSAYLVVYIGQRTRALDSRYELRVQRVKRSAEAMSTELGAGAWSYFGDPRAISHDGHTFTGWISTTGNVWVAHLRPDGRFTKKVIYKGLGVDDHNNPSLVFRPDGHIAVFFSPHSGRVLPPPSLRPSRMRYRISKKPFSIDGFGRVRLVNTNVPGGLGFTYPNPIQQRGKLWLFWRGGGWFPTFSYTRNGTDWVPARELLRSHENERPYSKYCGDGKTTDPRHLHRGPRQPLPQQPLLPRLREQRLPRRQRQAARQPAQRPAPDLQARADLQVHQGQGQRLAARHRAHLTRPPADRLHPPRRQPRHVLLRLQQRRALDQPQDRRGRPGLPVLHLGRRHARPRGPADRLPVAPHRRLPPGRGVVHARRRPQLAPHPAHRRARPLLHPAGDAARPARRQPRPVLARRPLDRRLHRLPHAHPLAGRVQPAGVAPRLRRRTSTAGIEGGFRWGRDLAR